MLADKIEPSRMVLVLLVFLGPVTCFPFGPVVCFPQIGVIKHVVTNMLHQGLTAETLFKKVSQFLGQKSHRSLMMTAIQISGVTILCRYV